MRICVIGGCGYIGSALVPELLARNHYVTVVDLLWFGVTLPPHPNLEFRCADAWSLKTSDLAPFDAVIFLAGLSNDPMADFSPSKNYIENAALPGYLAHIAAKANVKTFIHGGSCSVYGFDKDVDESTPVKTFSPYGVSKLMGEWGAMQQANAGLRVVSFRQGTVCGYSPRMRYDLIINAMVKDAITKREISVNDASVERPILDIRDAVNAYVFALEHEHVHGVYNLLSANATVYQIADLVQQRVVQLMGVNSKIRVKNVKDVRSYSASCERALAAGMEFKHSLCSTVDSVIDAYSPSVDYEAARFYNIKTFMRME